MVRGAPRQVKEEDHQRTHHNCPGEEAENVLVFGVERCQNCLQKVRLKIIYKIILLLYHRIKRKI